MHFVLVLTTAAGASKLCNFVVSSSMPSGSCGEQCHAGSRVAALFARALMQSKNHFGAAWPAAPIRVVNCSFNAVAAIVVTVLVRNAARLRDRASTSHLHSRSPWHCTPSQRSEDRSALRAALTGSSPP